MAMPWPPRNLVAECMTRSAPCSNGRHRYGVAKVESIISGRPCLWATSRHGLDVEHLQPRIAERLGEQQARLVGDGAREARGIARIGQRRGDAEARQRVREHVVRAAVDARRRNDVPAGPHQRGDGEMQRRLAAGGRHRADAAFQRRDALLQHGDGRVGDARIDVPGPLQVEQRGRVLGVVEHVGGGLVDRHGARAGGRIGPLAGMQAQACRSAATSVRSCLLATPLLDRASTVHAGARARPPYALRSTSRSAKCRRRCSQLSRASAGSAASAVPTKNADQPMALGHEAGAGREQRAPGRGQRGQQRVLRRRVQRIAAQRREVGDEDHGADGAGEVLEDDGHRQRPGARRLLAQPHEDQVGDHLQDGAEPQRRGQRQRARHGAAGKAADQQRRQPHALDDRGVGAPCRSRATARTARSWRRPARRTACRESRRPARPAPHRATGNRRTRPWPCARRAPARPTDLSALRLRAAAVAGSRAEQHGEQAHHHQRGGDRIGDRPHDRLVEASASPARRSARSRRRPTPACRCDRRRRSSPCRPPARPAARLSTRIGVDDDVLRGRGEGDQQRAEAHRERRRHRIARAEEQDGGHQQQLRGDQPAAPSAEPRRQPRHVAAHRRPAPTGT